MCVCLRSVCSLGARGRIVHGLPCLPATASTCAQTADRRHRRCPCPLLQNFGARDATEGEVASGFGENVLGNSDTDHLIRWVCVWRGGSM